MSVVIRHLGGGARANGAESALMLDCLALQDAGTGQQRVQVYFAPSVSPDQIDTAKAPGFHESRSIGGGLIITCARPETGPLIIPLRDAEPLEITPAIVEPDLFAGLNCAIVVRNDESLDSVCDWLSWHRKTQNLQAALIVDRGRPVQTRTFADALDKRLKESGDRKLSVVVLSSSVPLGKPGSGPESHPINAPDAPGKDRMSAPDPDPWKSPLGALSLYELLRWRFMGQARAVMNLDMNDILPKADGPNVFDQAVAAPQGYVRMMGERVYPWSIRKNKPARFGDHICRQFDNSSLHGRWCVAPDRLPDGVTWRLVRLPNVTATQTDVTFFRCMALRHRADGKDVDKISKIVPKSSLVESDALLRLAQHLNHKPLRMPEVVGEVSNNDRVAIVTTMKNEGPFILEWLAYHRVIGVDDFLVYTNDCDDGTDTMLELLQSKGLLQHRDNPFQQSGLKPQHAALAASEKEPMIKRAGWLICMDVDEFINIHVGDGTLASLFLTVPDANMISMTWRLFGNADVEDFEDGLITEEFTSCAAKMTRKPHQAWGFKTLFRNIGLFKKMGVHRPKGLKPQLVDQITWVNGSGQLMPKKEYRNAWRSTSRTVGYDLVTLNHYALRSAESFLVKRDRGRVNHVDRDQGLAYWFRMNNNAETDTSIQRMLPALRAEFDRLMADPDIAAAHAHSVARHRQRIDELKETEQNSAFFADLTGGRLRRLSRLHLHFGSSVFLAGPECIPEDFPQGELARNYVFTVPKGKIGS
jgi:glycosyl transferase family 2